MLELEPQPGSVSDEPRELAFIDGERSLHPVVQAITDATRTARRLARLRLVASPVAAHPPVSALGFDPVLTHPSFDEFRDLIAKKKGTVKGMIMDQGFSAGVGNVSLSAINTSRKLRLGDVFR